MYRAIPAGLSIMTVKWTSEMVRAAYDFLNELPPFNRWNLPQGEDIKFVITSLQRNYGDCVKLGRRFQIRISTANNGHVDTLMRTLSHEMIHVYLDKQRMHGRHHHGVAFKRCAKLVCDSLGFDPKPF
jgi:hypothetical protein